MGLNDRNEAGAKHPAGREERAVSIGVTVPETCTNPTGRVSFLRVFFFGLDLRKTPMETTLVSVRLFTPKAKLATKSAAR